jgi:hypothetical protein
MQEQSAAGQHPGIVHELAPHADTAAFGIFSFFAPIRIRSETSPIPVDAGEQQELPATGLKPIRTVTP